MLITAVRSAVAPRLDELSEEDGRGGPVRAAPPFLVGGLLLGMVGLVVIAMAPNVPVR